MRISLASVLLLAVACASPAGISRSSAIAPQERLTNSQLMQQGLAKLEAGEMTPAADIFRYVLKFDPQNAGAHAALAAIYDAQARDGDRSKLDLAEVGYRQALEFDPRNWFAAYRLGLLEMSARRYEEAANHLASAAIVRRDDADVLNALAAALYYAGKRPESRAVIERALALQPASNLVLHNATMIAAADGDFAAASDWRSQLMPGVAATALDHRIGDWRVEFARVPQSRGNAGAPLAMLPADTGKKRVAPATRSPFLVSGNAEQMTTLMSPLPAPPTGTKAQMVQVDVILIRTQEIETASRGVNLLQGLQLQFGGSDSHTTANPSLINGAQSQNIITRQITFPSVNYSLNIANNGFDRADVLARPTLVALDGQPAYFFSGEELSITVPGQYSGFLVDKKIGVELAVTPTMLDDNTVLLSVNATRSFINTSFVPEATSALRTTQQRVTTSVAVELGRTVVLSGLSEHQSEDSHVGVPVLQEIPGVQYLFSQSDHLVFEKSTLILLTPRRVGAVSSQPDGTWDAAGFDVMTTYFPELQKRLNNMQALRHELQSNGFRYMLEQDDMDIDDIFAHRDFPTRLGAQLRSVIHF